MVRVAIPTSDGKRVHLGHFGDAKYYYFYERAPEGWRLVCKRENPYAGEHHHDENEEHHRHGHRHSHRHGEGGKRQKILELVKDADVLVAVAFGPGGRDFMESQGKTVIIVKPFTTIEEALARVEEAIA